MRRSDTGLHVPLNQRGGPGTADSRSQESRPAEARACWVGVEPGVQVPGTVHAWQRDPGTGQWRALVAVWLPAEAVSPREA